ncbi:telomere-protecting terminal protein Tpg [Streptomyces lydicus]|uniref:telomere-protecting terminal protein Tpg n=1 Tax=Streptomyces lydicus TaxID=47763 RepID=UPI0036E6B74A
MGILGDSIETASIATATRPIPKSAGAQMRFLVKQHKGSTKAVAQLLGISQRTVERYVKDQIRRPRRELAARIKREVRRRWQPRVRQKAQQRAAQRTGITIEMRARFGFTAAPGTTDDGRIRLIRSARACSSAVRQGRSPDLGASMATVATPYFAA